jgi:hypothetical protein
MKFLYKINENPTTWPTRPQLKNYSMKNQFNSKHPKKKKKVINGWNFRFSYTVGGDPSVVFYQLLSVSTNRDLQNPHKFA